MLADKLALIWPLLGRQIAFHRSLVDLTASVKAALLLSQAVYWTRHGRDIEQRAGWFYKTMGQWEMETGLSTKEQAGARKILRRLAILQEQRAGVPAKLHFRLALDQLGVLLSSRIGMRTPCVDWDNGALVAELLGPALSYHRALALVSGGVNAGLMLSRALYLVRRHSRHQSDGWFCAPAAAWTQEIGLSRREQETARRDLTRRGMWEETICGIPPRVFARIRLACLIAGLDQYARRNSRLAHVSAPQAASVCGISINRIAQNGVTGLRESSLLVSHYAPNQLRQNSHHSFAESATSHVTGSTRVSVQPPAAEDERVDSGDTPSPRGGDWIFPDGLTPEEKCAASALVSRCPALAQALLDELTARMRSNSVKTSRIAYLRGMVTRALAGKFVPELGLAVAAARLKRREEAIVRARRDADERRLAAERASPEYQLKVAEHRARIRGMLAMAQARRPRRERP
ncbi:MAG: hypothetical protein IH606_01560 [Burkholderiales bacterium]|nr:hypothetical protein [Burkholderiales bacterium]